MDFYETSMIIDKNTKIKCIDEEFQKKWESDPYIQSWIAALKSVYGTQDGDNKGQDMNLHMRCKSCGSLDIVLIENGKSWKCPSCEFNQPERSKREDLSAKPLPDPYLPKDLKEDPNVSVEVYGKYVRLT